MREDEVLATAVDIERFAEVAPAHRRALDVPAGPAAPPRAVPAGVALARRLPKDEVGRVFLVRSYLDAGADDHILQRAPRQRAVFRHRCNIEEKVVLGDVG